MNVTEELTCLKVAIVKSYCPGGQEKSTVAAPHPNFELGALLMPVELYSSVQHCQFIPIYSHN
jgi:hypothetical protein